MKYVLLGSLGNITKPLAQKLITAGQEVTIVSSQPDKGAAIRELGAQAATASVEDPSALAQIFKGADAVYTMIPPKWDATDWKKYTVGIGENFAAAIKSAGVKKVVNLSSIGAHMPEGCGPVSGIHFAEKALNALGSVDILHLRPGYFYLNLLHSIGMIKHAGFFGNNYGADNPVVMVHPNDIAAAAAEELLALSFRGTSVRYIAGDERTSKDITAVLGAAIGKPDLPYVEFKDEDAFKGGVQAGLTEEVSHNYMEMGQAIRSGEMFADYRQHRGPLSPVRLEEFAKEFAAAYAKA